MEPQWIVPGTLIVSVLGAYGQIYRGRIAGVGARREYVSVEWEGKKLWDGAAMNFEEIRQCFEIDPLTSSVFYDPKLSEVKR